MRGNGGPQRNGKEAQQVKYEEFQGVQDQLADAFAAAVRPFQEATAEVDGLEKAVIEALDRLSMSEEV